MREILFRGKRVDNGEWVYGLLVRVSTDISNIVEKKFEILTPVHTHTVGQYTGLTDKNGKKIFEGDIVKTFKYNETEYRERVYFFNGCFFYGSWNWIEFRNAFRELEIIGNIFDNPELIKER